MWCQGGDIRETTEDDNEQDAAGAAPNSQVFCLC